MAYENQFLDTLEPADLACLAPHLRQTSLALGQVLIEQDEPVVTVHFPVGTQLANVVAFQQGAGIETSVIGAEGVSGLAPFMADARCAWRVIVRKAGSAWIAPASLLRRLSAERPSFMAHLLKLTHYYQAQAAQSAACNATHKVLARVARWLLMADDLEPGAGVQFTQEELAALLGAQRTTVNDAATRLKNSGAIRYLRGLVTIRDRALLQTYACECYPMHHARAVGLNVLPESGRRHIPAAPQIWSTGPEVQD